MYYRYEVKMRGKWEGIFSMAAPGWRRRIGRYIKEPSWYRKQKDPGSIPTRCWFTEYGFQKYHHLIEEMIEDHAFMRVETRLITSPELGTLVSKGKVQVIELCSA